jgi:beta-xylosidase
MLCSIDEHLGLAVSKSPLGPFIPQGGFLFESTIDGHIYFEGDKMYIYYVTWREGHTYGIWGCEMKDDYRVPDLQTERCLIVPDKPYEQNMGNVTEGPYMLKRDGVYYLTYSGCGYESEKYCVCYATSSSPLGEFVKYKNNPILIGDGVNASGTGHHCFVESPEGELLIVYHRHNKPGVVQPRDTCIGRARFVRQGGEIVLRCDPPI